MKGAKLSASHILHRLNELIPVPINIQERHRLRVNLEELPAKYLEKFFQGFRGHRAIATKASALLIMAILR